MWIVFNINSSKEPSNYFLKKNHMESNKFNVVKVFYITLRSFYKGNPMVTKRIKKIIEREETAILVRLPK